MKNFTQQKLQGAFGSAGSEHQTRLADDGPQTTRTHHAAQLLPTMATAGKTITCRAAVCWEPLKPLSVEEVTVDPPQEGEVRVRMVAASICQTDFSALKGYVVKGFFEGMYPVIPGHEGVGVVESVGPGVTSVGSGDHVVPTFGKQCNKCRFCQSDDTNMCAETDGFGLMPDGSARAKARGKALHQLASLGTFAEYSVMAETSLAKVDAGVPMAHLSPIGCCIPTGVGTALNEARVARGSSCAVWGLGGVGLSVVLGCRLAGAATIVGVDVNPGREALARKFGCTDFIDASALDRPVAEYMAERYNGGFDFTFESAGSVVAMREAYESCRYLGGRCVVVGGSPAGSLLAVSPNDLMLGRRISGCLFGLYRFRNDLPKLVDMVSAGQIPIDDYITHTMRLDQINEALEVMKSGESVRIAIQIQAGDS